ncbi:MAG: hypothetical protein DCC71_18445 [Proteobacteria bacterium]|nr:MAG: hypothetical protein DCC71_18445 [Pseudomonadota bacterium]
MGEFDPAGFGLGHGSDAAERYRVEVLPWAEVVADGVRFREGAEPRLLPWARILSALAAHVGEPEGVSTVVFDLVIERKDSDVLVCRFDADPGDAAQETARRLYAKLGRERCSRSLCELAADGVPSRSYVDLESLAAGSLEDLGL